MRIAFLHHDNSYGIGMYHIFKTFFQERKYDHMRIISQKRTRDLLDYIDIGKQYNDDSSRLILPVSIKGELELKQHIFNYNPNIIISADTMLKIPMPVLSFYSAYGLHPGPLPQIKGLYPLVRDLTTQQLNNEKKIVLTGSIFKLSEQIDEGRVLDNVYMYYSGENLHNLHNQMYQLLAEQFIRRFDQYILC